MAIQLLNLQNLDKVVAFWMTKTVMIKGYVHASLAGTKYQDYQPCLIVVDTKIIYLYYKNFKLKERLYINI